MKVPLQVWLEDGPALLQQEAADGPGVELLGAPVEKYLHVLAKPTTIVVLHGLGVPKRLQQGVAVHDPPLYAVVERVAPGHQGEVVEHQLRRLRLSRPALPTHNDGLVPGVCKYGPEHPLRHLVTVGREVPQGDRVVVLFHERGVVDVQPLERVHRDQDRPCAGVDLVHLEPVLEVIQHGRLVQVRHVVHVVVPVPPVVPGFPREDPLPLLCRRHAVPALPRGKPPPVRRGRQPQPILVGPQTFVRVRRHVDFFPRVQL